MMTLKAKEESARVQSALNEEDVERHVHSIFEQLSAALQDPSDAWKSVIPGKQILSQFANAAGIEIPRFKIAYMNTVAKYNFPIFDEVISMFADFSSASIAVENKAIS